MYPRKAKNLCSEACPPYLIKPVTLYRPRLTFIQGQRGNKLLVIGGYTYARNNFSGTNTIYWACRTSHDGVRCNSRVVTSLMVNGLYRIMITNPKHNHPRRVNLSREHLFGVGSARFTPPNKPPEPRTELKF
uniref:FLYWCH-type domain-containing protein n=1 Tax=Anopheles christyi TaxID=43041 RepID=A0A182JNK9_9DIPT